MGVRLWGWEYIQGRRQKTPGRAAGFTANDRIYLAGQIADFANLP
jgi:hypothetical protein